jgi:hypothetical protein
LGWGGTAGFNIGGEGSTSTREEYTYSMGETGEMGEMGEREREQSQGG